MKKTLLLGFALLIAQPAMAKDYIIELLMFKHTTRADGINWQPGVLLPARADGLPVFGNGNTGEFQAMETGPALLEMAETLARSTRYPMISYRTWQQPGLARDDAKSIRINVGERIDVWDTGDLPPRAGAQRGVGDDYQNFTLASIDPSFGGAQRRTYMINGTVTVTLGRYLHLYTDLVYTDLRSGRSTLQKSHRRMRSKRSHYVDNPAFGIIAHITPVEEPEEEQAPIEEATPVTDDAQQATSSDS